jgi:epoxyqueuosine reductase
MDLKESLRREARRLGFSRLGFTAPGLHPEAARLRQWLDSDYAGEMAWLHRRSDERSDTARLIPWARTILVAALPYSSGEPESSPSRDAKISRYARGKDYHKVLKERLGRLGKFLSEISPGTRSAPIVDTGALLEKPWAASAGLGWQGKHTNLIDPESGSWFFLGELATDLKLEPDAEAIADRCGSCTRCLEACPTQAFPEPYVLDSRKCISYLTIEHRGTIPEELRAGMGSWVFGCDVCQEVCPWNQAPAQGDQELEAVAETPALSDLIRMSREEFQRHFAGTPLRRTGWIRFVRNVAVALGNSGDPEAVQPLRDALAIPNPVIQEHVRWALRRLGAESRSEEPAVTGSAP